MPKLPTLTGNELVVILVSKGFRVVRQKGSHVRLINKKCSVTVPVHTGKTIPRGLLRKIIREDLRITIDDFCQWM